MTLYRTHVGLIIAVPLTKLYGIYGCVSSIALSILFSNVIAANIVFYRVVKIDVLGYWKGIMRMIWLPMVAIYLCMYLKRYILIDSMSKLIGGLCIFCFCYLPIFSCINMSKQEKEEIKRFVENIKTQDCMKYRVLLLIQCILITLSIVYSFLCNYVFDCTISIIGIKLLITISVISIYVLLCVLKISFMHVYSVFIAAVSLYNISYIFVSFLKEIPYFILQKVLYRYVLLCIVIG